MARTAPPACRPACAHPGLHAMARGHVLALEGEELATDREAGVVLRFRDARHLQQLQRGATGTDEHEAGVGGGLGAGLEVLHRHVPALVGVLPQRAHFVVQVQAEVRAALQAGGQLARDHAEVDVGAERHPGRSHLLLRVTAFHQQRCPLLDLPGIFGILHAVEQRVLHQGLLALVQVGDVVIAPDEAPVRGRVDAVAGLAQPAFLHLVRPELARDLERFGDADRTLGLDAAIGQFRGVVQLGEGRMAGTGVVPAIGAFTGNAVEA
ncbi:hypothetical protein G6F31_015556 [Rhizopus arrhizus]|nr:hypothetical protein G6F31_015556 [Rhizopus arrhizus]